MLEFVHLTGAEAGKDLQTRRKVRSQAMRDFRRRQREEREAATRALKSDLPKASRKSMTPDRRQGSPPTKAKRPRAASASSSVFQVQKLDYTTADGHLSVPATHTPPITLHREYSSSESSCDSYFKPRQQTQTYSQSASPYLHAQWIDQQTQSVPRSPSSWLSDTEDPFQSPAQLNQMFNFCKSYLHWLHPGVDGEHARNVFSQAWQKSHSPMVLAACCLASVGHLDAVQPNRPGGQYEMYKARVLRDISVRMRSPDTATSQETISALGLLTSFEMSRGSDEALTHLRGLKGIFNMKEGVGAVEIDGLSFMLETLDLVHSVMFDSGSVLFEADQLQLDVSSQTDARFDLEIFGRLLPYFEAEQASVRSDSVLFDRKLEGVSELCTLVDEAVRKSLTQADQQLQSTDPSISERWRGALHNFQTRTWQNGLLSGDAHLIARACHAFFALVFNVAMGLPQRDPTVQPHVEELYQATEKVAPHTWAELPYLRFFVLFTGLMGSDSVGKRSFFKAHLVRAVYRMGSRDWRRVKHFSTKHLWISRSFADARQRSRSPPEQRYTPGPRHGRHLVRQDVDPSPRRSGTSPDLPCWELSPFRNAMSLPASRLTTPYHDDKSDPFDELGFVDDKAFPAVHPSLIVRSSTQQPARTFGHGPWGVDLG